MFVALLTLLGGGAAAALAATHGSAGAGRKGYLADVAGRLGVPVGALAAAMKAANVDRIEAAAAAGRISRSRADALKQRIQHGAGAPLFAFGHGQRSGGGLLAVAAGYLGISPAQLRSERRAGRSLAQMADATPGRSVEGLKAAILAAATKRLAAAVAGGQITAQQESARLSRLSPRLDKLLARVPHAHSVRARRRARRAG